METIFLSIFNYALNSSLSGITWDIIKQRGEKVIGSFKRKARLINSFEKEEDADKFLEIIFKKQPTSQKRPFNDLKTEYEELTDKDYTEDFQKLFTDWITENKTFFNECIDRNISQSGVIYINAQQTATMGGKVYNIANQFNNKF